MSDDLSWCLRPAKPEENGNLELCLINKSQELHTWYDPPSVAVWKSALKQHVPGVTNTKWQLKFRALLGTLRSLRKACPCSEGKLTGCM